MTPYMSDIMQTLRVLFKIALLETTVETVSLETAMDKFSSALRMQIFVASVAK